MSKRYPWAKWTLPETIDPAVRRCFIVPVPDDPFHLAAFRGALLALGSAYKWQDDEAHTAKLVADVWREIYDLVEERTCEVPLIDVRQNEELPCTLEKTTDGAIWSAFANLKLCPPQIRTGVNGGLEFFDGSDWIPIPGQGDERQDGTYTPPWPSGEVPPGESGACLAAENITAFFASGLTQLRQGLEAGLLASAAVGVLVGVVSFFMPWALFAAAGLLFADAAEGLGIAGINDMLTDGTLDDLKCAINCNIGADGVCTASQFTAIEANVTEVIGGVKASIINNWLDGFGPVGLTRQGKAAGIVTGNCDMCTDCLYSIIYFYRPNPNTLFDQRVVREGDTFAVPFYGSQGHYGVNIVWKEGDCNDVSDITLDGWTPVPGYEQSTITHCNGSTDHNTGGIPGSITELTNGTFWTDNPATVMTFTIGTIRKP